MCDSATCGVQIAGLNTTFTAYIDRMVVIHNFLQQRKKSGDDMAGEGDGDGGYLLDDNDCVVIVDAYDVLLTPAAKRICEVGTCYES